MPATLALLADTVGGVMMAEIGLSKLTCSLIENILIVKAIIVVVP